MPRLKYVEFQAQTGAREEAKKSLPSFMWEPADAVARCGVDAMAHGRVVAIPGSANRAAAMFAHLVPKQLLVPMLAARHPGLKNR